MTHAAARVGARRVVDDLRRHGHGRARGRAARNARRVVRVAAGRPAGRLAHHPPGQLRHRELAERDRAGSLESRARSLRSHVTGGPSARHGAPPVVCRPATSKQSFHAHTVPASGPTSSPRRGALLQRARPRRAPVRRRAPRRRRGARPRAARSSARSTRSAIPRAAPMAWNDRTMVLSDRSIREALAAGRITIDPFDDELVQPSSVDVRCDHRFRVFHPGRYPYIDVKQADARPDRAGRDRRRARLHPASRASSSWARRSSASACRTTSSRASTARARSGASACRCTRRPGSPTRASRGRSRSSCPT